MKKEEFKLVQKVSYHDNESYRKYDDWIIKRIILDEPLYYDQILLQKQTHPNCYEQCTVKSDRFDKVILNNMQQLQFDFGI